MIIRVVQMTFQEDKVPEFKLLFEEKKQLIRNSAGCKHLELWQDAKNLNVFFTYSMWDNEEQLDHYRFSPLFKDIWPKTKALFAAKPQAWSVVQKTIVEGKEVTDNQD
jgi:quinol monooxygenase YgiN